MVTAASLAGIDANGSKWKTTVKVAIPDNIPQLFSELDTEVEVVQLAYNVASKIVKDLRAIADPVVSGEVLERLEEIAEQLEISFVWEDLTLILELSKDDLTFEAENAPLELENQLKDLYDWANYNRILLFTGRK